MEDGFQLVLMGSAAWRSCIQSYAESTEFGANEGSE